MIIANNDILLTENRESDGNPASDIMDAGYDTSSSHTQLMQIEPKDVRLSSAPRIHGKSESRRIAVKSSRSSKTEEDLSASPVFSTIKRISAKCFCIMASLLLAFSVIFSAIAPDACCYIAASSGKTFDYSAKNLLESDVSQGGETPKEWNQEVIRNVDSKNLSKDKTESDAIIKSLRAVAYHTSCLLIGFSVLISAARLAGRGIYNIAFTSSQTASKGGGKWDDIGYVASMPRFLRTRSEKNVSAGFDDEWIRHMLWETALYIGIAVAASAIISVLAMLATFVLDNTNDATGHQYDHFTLGGSDVKTDTNSQ